MNDGVIIIYQSLSTLGEYTLCYHKKFNIKNVKGQDTKQFQNVFVSTHRRIL